VVSLYKSIHIIECVFFKKKFETGCIINKNIIEVKKIMFFLYLFVKIPLDPIRVNNINNIVPNSTK